MTPPATGERPLLAIPPCCRALLGCGLSEGVAAPPRCSLPLGCSTLYVQQQGRRQAAF